MNTEYTILPLNVKNGNGRIYRHVEIKKALERRKPDEPLMITNGNNGIFSFHDAVGVVENLELRINELVGTVRPLDGKEWIMSGLEDGSLHVRTAGQGCINKSGEVYDFALTHTILTNDPA